MLDVEAEHALELSAVDNQEPSRGTRAARWDAAYDAMASGSVSDDLAKALREAGLEHEFAALDSRNRYAILHLVQTAKRPQTRARRITKYVEMLAAGDKPYPIAIALQASSLNVGTTR
jgi:uncharacterized protein YdeI (YjbR/CyaY-like superfamily)